MIKNILLIILVFCCFRHGVGCTDFLLEDLQNKVVAARSMEFAVKLDSQIAVHPKGERISKNGVSWTNRYGYIGITAFHHEILADGFNEAGLSFGALWFPGAKYPSLKKGIKTLPLESLGDWALGNFSTVSEVKEALKKIQILPQDLPKIQAIPLLHFSFHDRAGNSLVVEFINGKMEISDNPIDVLTNAPKFSWHVINLSNYIHLTAINKVSIDLDGTVIGPAGQGSGLLGIPGDWTPPSRFIRIATYKDLVDKAPGPDENINLAFHLLNTVDIPYGGIRPTDGIGYNYTQWVVVKDLERNTLSYRTYNNLNLVKISLADYLSKAGNKVLYFPLETDH